MRFDFTGRYQAAFGYLPANVSKRLDADGFGEIQSDTPSALAVYLSDSSTAFDEVRLHRDVNGSKEEYLFAYRSLAGEEGSYAGVFATPPALSLSRRKRLVVTPVDKSDIEVVERYATEPWEMNWRGLLIDLENHEFPLRKMQELNRIFEVNGVWNVDSEILNRVGVQALYIKDINLDFVEGYEDTIAYTLVTRSIRPLEYQILNR